ncbi:MAG: tol-pal system protein YbgF [Deltaproteobacteria bacterium]|nr:tol-pal system protein YbgF [Deltaproteobacteria bacterium]
MRAPTLALALSAVACSGGMADVRKEVRALRETVEEMARSNAAVRTRIDDVDGRLLLLQDEVETQRMAAMRGVRLANATPPPSLPVVKVQPPSEEAYEEVPARGRSPGGSRDALLDVQDPVYQDVDEFGRVVPARGGTGAGSAARRDAAPETARKASPRVAGKPVASQPDDAGRISEYQAAYSLYEQGRVQEAMKALAGFVARNPRHAYADNAQYWIGECHYDVKDWVAAKREFMKVVTEHPDGNKVPDAMVKAGLCARMLRLDDEARTMLDAVVLTYPESAAAGVALRLLAEMP